MRISVRLNEKDSVALRRLIEETGCSASELLRAALQDRLRQPAPEAPPGQNPALAPKQDRAVEAARAKKETRPPAAPRPFDQGVGVRILAVPLDPLSGLYDDGPLQRFLADKQLLRIEPAFVAQGGNPHWSVWVQYLPRSGEAERRRPPGAPPLDEAAKRLLERLRHWRKERAGRDGVPVFVVATNRELEDLARRRPRTLTDLQQVKGFGVKKVKRYGAEILVLMQPEPD